MFRPCGVCAHRRAARTARLRRRYGRTHTRNYGPIGTRLDGGNDVRDIPNHMLGVYKARAWDTPNMHDLLVLDRELKRRGMKGVWG